MYARQNKSTPLPQCVLNPPLVNPFQILLCFSSAVFVTKRDFERKRMWPKEKKELFEQIDHDDFQSEKHP